MLTLGRPRRPLAEIARQAAAAITLADRYTDTFARGQRRKQPRAAAEIQQSLLPPRISRISGGEVAGNVLPSYEVAGDWFDIVENLDGVWITLADGLGPSTRAAASSAVALGALRASRRSGGTTHDALMLMHRTLREMPGPSAEMTAMAARWDPATFRLEVVNCGHVGADRDPRRRARSSTSRCRLGAASAAVRARGPPSTPPRSAPGDRLLMCSDGVITDGEGQAGPRLRRRRRGGAALGAGSAADTVRKVHRAVLEACGDEAPGRRDRRLPLGGVIPLAPDGTACPIAVSQVRRRDRRRAYRRSGFDFIDRHAAQRDLGRNAARGAGSPRPRAVAGTDLPLRRYRVLRARRRARAVRAHALRLGQPCAREAGARGARRPDGPKAVSRAGGCRGRRGHRTCQRGRLRSRPDDRGRAASGLAAPAPSLHTGPARAEIANAVAQAVHESTGKGPTRTRAFIEDEFVFCILEEPLTEVERALRDGGDLELVRELRRELFAAARERVEEPIARVTGRRVLASATVVIAEPELGCLVLALGGQV